MLSLRPKNIRAKKFNYTPRYYDAEQEEREERRKERLEAKELGSEGTKKRISRGLREGKGRNNKLRKNAALRSNIILIAIVVALCAFCYIFIQNYLPQFIESWFEQ